MFYVLSYLNPIFSANKIHTTACYNAFYRLYKVFIEHALTELECLRFMLKEPFKIYNGIYFLVFTLKFIIK